METLLNEYKSPKLKVVECVVMRPVALSNIESPKEGDENIPWD